MDKQTQGWVDVIRGGELPREDDLERLMNTPPPKRVKKKPRTRTPGREAEVLKECMKALRAWGWYAERRNTGKFQLTDGGFVSFGCRGAADIFAVSPCGFHVEIECKRREGGKQSPSQVTFEALMVKHGISYFVVRSALELRASLVRAGLKTP